MKTLPLNPEHTTRKTWKRPDVAKDRCKAKIVYNSWTEAETAAIILIEDLREGKLSLQKGYAVYAYICSVCYQWHIGHTGKPSHAFKPKSGIFSRIKTLAPVS